MNSKYIYLITITVRLRFVGCVGGDTSGGRGGSGSGFSTPAATANYSFSGEWSEGNREGKSRGES